MEKREIRKGKRKKREEKKKTKKKKEKIEGNDEGDPPVRTYVLTLLNAR